MKKILFITGTRADYGKIKSLMRKVDKNNKFELHIFVTGMHMLSRYGSTWKELEKDGFKRIYRFINQQNNTKMDIALSNTILGLSNYVNEVHPDMIVVHGDRLEALAGAIVGAFNNIRVSHIEGGEVSGTIDESIRHSITKFAHVHLVSNKGAKRRIIQLGEKEENIFIIGSPDIDIMLSKSLPKIDQVKKRYDINFDNYAILMYHPVTTEVEQLKKNIKDLVNAVIDSNKNYVVIYPNNDEGSLLILDEYNRFKNNPKFKIFPSIRFEYFLTLLKHSEFMIGNSSAGIMETCVYGIPAIDIGNRQKGRYNLNKFKNMLYVDGSKGEIIRAIDKTRNMGKSYNNIFGDGKSSDEFIKILEEKNIWELKIEKKFIDI